MKLIERISGALFRTFVFNSKLRSVLLKTLSLQIRQGVSPLDFFRMLHLSTEDLNLRSIAKLSVDSLERGKPFAFEYADEKYFTEDDARLLCAAERAGTVPDIVNLLLTKEDKETSFSKVVFWGNFTWISAIVILSLFTIAGRSYERTFSAISGGVQADFFALGEYLQANLIYILGSIVTVWGIYFVARSLVLGPLRSQLKQIGIFKFHDMKSAANVCRLFAAICGTNDVSPMEMLKLGRDVSRDNNYLYTSLQKCIDDLGVGIDPIESLGTHLLSPNAALQLKLMTPSKSPEEMAKAFEAIAESTFEDTKWVLESMSQVTGYVLMIITLLMAYPLMEVSMGATITV